MRRMARPKEYNREKVVDAATQLFWKKGYYGTPLSELVAVTGLNKHSLYKEFGNKEGLFNECLVHYRLTVAREFLDILQQEPLGLGNIRAFLKNRVEFMGSEDFKSCLTVKCVVEKELVEESSLEQATILYKKIDKTITACLESALKRGELVENADIGLISLYLTYFSSGMNVVGMPENGKEEAEKMIEFVMSTFSK